MVALAALTCGRLSGAQAVRAGRGQCVAAADQYRVTVTEPGLGSRVAWGAGDRDHAEVVFEHWGGDAELLALRAPVNGAVGRTGPRERARIAARMIRYYELDTLQITYPDGGQLTARMTELVLHGPPRGVLRRRARLLRASVADLLSPA